MLTYHKEIGDNEILAGPTKLNSRPKQSTADLEPAERHKVHRQLGRVLSRAFPGRGGVLWRGSLSGLGLGNCFAAVFHGFAIGRAREEKRLARTYLDGGDYVGAAAAAAGKLYLGLCWKQLVQGVAEF